MKISNNTLRRIIREVTNEPIENKAIYFLSVKLEDKIKEITQLAIKLHNERNEIRIINGLPEKKRLSEEVFKEILNNKNKN